MANAPGLGCSSPTPANAVAPPRSSSSATVCGVCGVVGFERLLLSCNGCNGAVHQYCLANVLFDASVLKGWWCNECQPRHGEVTCEGSLHVVPNERLSSHVHSGSGVHLPSTTVVESAREAGLSGNHRNKSFKSKRKSRRKTFFSSKKSLRKKRPQIRSNMQPMGNKANRLDHDATNISCASGKVFRSCGAITMETAKASNHRIDPEDCVDEAVLTGDSNGQNLKNGRQVKNQKCVEDVNLDILIPESSGITRPVKKRRRCIEVNKYEKVIIVTNNGKCALNDASKLTSQTVVAQDHLLQSRMAFDSESAYEQCCIYSQPIDEPIWSGIIRINDKVYVTLAAFLSSKACEIVWELSRSLRPIVQVIKLPRLEAWPKSWNTSGPTDDNIALYFFPPSMRMNDDADSLVEEIIESDGALKVVVDIAELLIFPSTILPEQYHVRQGKHYLWGVFKRREDQSDKDILVEEQGGSACAVEEGEMEEPFIDEQYEVQCDSPDLETSVVKHVVHVETQEDAMKADMREGLGSPGISPPSAKPNPPKARSSCSTQPTIDPKLHAPEEVDHQKDEQDFTKPSGDSGPAAVTSKSIDSAGPGAEPMATKLFGFVSARTPRAQQLIQEMVSEGALLFSVTEEMVTPPDLR